MNKERTHKNLFLKKIGQVITVLFIAFVANVFAINTFDVDAYTVTNGKVKIDIPDYDETIGWVPGTVYSAKINVDFEEDTSTGKEVKVKVPMGMRYVSYPSASPATSGDLKSIETAASGDFIPLLDSTTSATKGFAPSYYDEVVYTIKQNAKKVEFTVKLTVDEYLYYGPKTFSAADGIQVSAEKAGNSIGLAQMEVKAINGGNLEFVDGVTGYVADYTVLEGDTDLLVTKTSTGGYRGGFLYPTYFYAKDVEVFYYYPIASGINFVGADDIYDGCTYANNATDGYVKIDCAGVRAGAFFEKMKFDTSGATAGTYQHLDGATPKKHIVEYTAYDGTKLRGTTSGALMVAPTINVVNNAEEKLTLDANNRYYSNLTDDYSAAMTYKLSNDILSVKKDQIFEFEADNNLIVDELVLPADVKSFKYKTNLNSNWTTLNVSLLTNTNSPNNSLPTFNNKKMGLATGEYITNAIAELEDIEKGYTTNTSQTHYSFLSARALVKLNAGSTIGYATFKTYKLDANDDVDEDTLTEQKAWLKSADTLASGKLSTGLSKSIPDTTIPAGTTKKVTAVLTTNGYYYSTSLGLVNPAIYLKIPAGVTIDRSSIQVTSPQVSGSIDFAVSNVYTINGERYLEIDVDQNFGGYFDSKAISRLNVSFDMQTTLLAKGNYKWNEYAFLMDKSNKTIPSQYAGQVDPIQDVNDIDRDGNTDEKLYPFMAKNLIIQEKDALIIDTYIKASAADEREADYNIAKPETAVSFTPGTEAIYTVDIYNNRSDAPGTLAQTTAYIPVPKKDLDFGTNFQENPGYWNMKLGSAVPVIKVYDVNPITGAETDVTSSKAANYKLEYSTNASNATDYQGATYSTTQSANTTMIRITNTTGIDVQEKAVIEFVYVVDETATSVIGTDKLGKINDFRPFYYYESAGNSGSTTGTRVGANLVIGEISGLAFEDKDASGTYNAGDAVLNNIDVYLYKKNESTGNYDPYIDPSTSVQAKATTGTDGKYKFGDLPNGVYKIDFSNIVSSTTVFTPKNVGSDYKIDSDVDESGSNKGMALDLDPTKDPSKFIYAGLLKYNPPTDLKMTFDDNTTATKSISILGPLDGTGAAGSATIKMKLEPDFFETIADKSYDNDGMMVASSDSSKAIADWTGTLVDKGSYLETSGTISGIATGSSVVTFSIKDVYGQTKELKVNVTVTANSRPVISASDVSVEAGDTTFSLTNLATIADAEDGSSTTATVGIKSNGGFDVTKVGTYTVIYKSLTPDKDGNHALDKTIKVKVVDTTKPVTKITPTPAGATVNPTAITVSATDNANGTITHSWTVVNSSNATVSSGAGANVTVPTVDGVYTAKAKSKDASGNESTEVTYTFTIDKTKPIINADASKSGKVGSTKPSDLKALYNVSASDSTDSSINASKVTVTDNINMNKVGTYKVTFKVTDAAGNEQVKEVSYVVVALEVSGIIYEDANYNSTKDDSGVLSGVTVRLLDKDTNAVLATTTSDSAGKYKFSMPVGSETTTKYVISVVEKAGYILANKGTDSIINLTTLRSDDMSVNGVDYLNKHIGMARNVSASLAPTTLKVYVGDTVTASYSVTNGTKITESLNNSNVTVSDNGSGGYNITGKVAGSSVLTTKFTDGYSRNDVLKTININVVALPTAKGKNITLAKGEEKASGITFTPTDGNISYTSLVPTKATVDSTGKVKGVEKGSSIISGKVVTKDTEAKNATANIAAVVGNNTVIGTPKTRANVMVGMGADDFILTWAEANAITDAMIKTKSEVFADLIDLDNMTITPINDSDISVDYSSINLSSVPEDGTKDFTITYEAKGVSTTSTVTIAGKNTVIDPVTQEALSAKDFSIKVSEIAGLNDSKVISLASAKAWKLSDGTSVAITSVDYSTIKASQVPDNGVKAFNVTFKTAAGTTKVVKAYVAGKNVVIKDDEAITAQGFSIKADKVKGLTKAKVISLAKAKAWNILDNSNVVITSVDYSKVKAKAGTYKVTFTTAKGTSITVDVKVTAVDGDDDDDDDKDKPEPPITGTDTVAMALGLIAVSGLIGSAYGLTRRRVSIN